MIMRKSVSKTVHDESKRHGWDEAGGKDSYTICEWVRKVHPEFLNYEVGH